jgi:hypothetical protein
MASEACDTHPPSYPSPATSNAHDSLEAHLVAKAPAHEEQVNTGASVGSAVLKSNNRHTYHAADSVYAHASPIVAVISCLCFLLATALWFSSAEADYGPCIVEPESVQQSR